MKKKADSKCGICHGDVYYMNIDGIATLCPACDTLRIAEAIKKSRRFKDEER